MHFYNLLGCCDILVDEHGFQCLDFEHSGHKNQYIPTVLLAEVLVDEPGCQFVGIITDSDVLIDDVFGEDGVIFDFIGEVLNNVVAVFVCDFD
jgi:hypothetical protein